MISLLVVLVALGRRHNLFCHLRGGTRHKLLLDRRSEALLERNQLGVRSLAAEPGIGRQGRLVTHTVREQIRLERVRLARYGKADGLDRAVRDLVGAGNLALVDIEGTLGHEGDTTLRDVGAKLGQSEQLVVLVLVVADVAVTLSGQVQHVAVAVVEGHDDSRGGVEVGGAQGVVEVGAVPDVDLAI